VPVRLPVEESAPSDAWLLLHATVPLFLLTLGLGLVAPLWVRTVVAVGIALGWRYLPWFHRPESIMLNVLVGWWAGELLWFVVR